MRFVVVDRVLDLLRLDRVPGVARRVEFAEQAAQFAGVGLAQEGVDFLDQRRNAGLFVHRLVGQRTELAAQRGDHPARQIDVAALGGAEMLLDRDHLLLRDEAVPAAERLGVVGGIRSEEHTAELQSLMRNSYAVFCLEKKKKQCTTNTNY